MAPRTGRLERSVTPTLAARSPLRQLRRAARRTSELPRQAANRRAVPELSSNRSGARGGRMKSPSPRRHR